MTLTTRLNLFFLTALAVVLAGFSGGLYVLASRYFQRQNEHRLVYALNTLVAATEIGPEGVVWEVNERRLGFGDSRAPDQVAWVVSDSTGQEIDRSMRTDAADFHAALRKSAAQAEGSHRLTWNQQAWLVRQQRVETPSGPSGPQAAARAALTRHDDPRHRLLTIAAGIPLGPTTALMRRLGLALAGLSAGIWMIALVTGTAVCRRALAPVRRMAAAARETDGAELGTRLPVPATGDELADLGGAFNDLLSRLQESFERQRQFTGNASHQLRTPLAGILGQIEVTLRRPRTADEYRESLQNVEKSASQLKRIVEALLFLARADAESALPDQQRFNLAEWLPTYVQSWSSHDRFPNMTVDLQAIGACWVEAQPVLLAELLGILIDNACKYSPAGSPIVIRLRTTEKTIILEVEDRGSGLEEGDVERLFTPFFRAVAARQERIDGIGLGLAIARRVAVASGGSLTVNSRRGEGTCFAVRLPKADDGSHTRCVSRNLSSAHQPLNRRA